MAKITVEGSETTVTLIETEREDGETLYKLKCDKGAWCPRYSDLLNYESIDLGEAIAYADIHADIIMHA